MAFEGLKILKLELMDCMFIVDSAVRKGYLRGVCLAVLGRWGMAPGSGQGAQCVQEPPGSPGVIWESPKEAPCEAQFLSLFQSLGQIFLLSEARNLYSHLQNLVSAWVGIIQAHWRDLQCKTMV